MLADGVHIRLFEPSFLHAKHLSIDDQVAVVGSSNLDIRSFTLNNEISLIIYDASVVGELVRVECDYVVHSHELTAETWEKRGVLQRIGQNMMRLADALL
jgi:cardiolipin synthase